MKKKILGLVTLSAITATLFGCMGTKYNVDYCGSKSMFKGAKDTYRAGETVTLYFDLIATDTDYTFYVDGEYFSPDYDDKKGFIISFVMPDHDVTVDFSHRNTMLYMQPMRCLTLMPGNDPDGERDILLNAEWYELGQLTFDVTNNTGEDVRYYDDYALWKKDDEGIYQFVEPLGEITKGEERHILTPGDTVTLTADLTVYGELGGGDYHLTKGDNMIMYFSLFEEWTE